MKHDDTHGSLRFTPCSDCIVDTIDGIRQIEVRLTWENPTWTMLRVESRARIEWAKGVRS